MALKANCGMENVQSALLDAMEKPWSRISTVIYDV